MNIDHIENCDCLDLLKSLPDKSVDISFTSPPYNRKRNDKYAFYSDTIPNYFEFLKAVTDEMLRVTKKHVFLNVQKNFYNKKEVFDYIGHYAGKIVEVVIWEKSNPMPASGHNITNGVLGCLRRALNGPLNPAYESCEEEEEGESEE